MQRMRLIFRLLSLCLLLVLSLNSCKSIRSFVNIHIPPTSDSNAQAGTKNEETGAKEVARHSLSSLALGFSHTCALTEAGNVKCWGRGECLGNGSDNTDKPVPVNVLAAEGSTDLLDDIVQVSAGERHTCALTSGGNVKCWGYYLCGNRSDGRQTICSVPTYVVETAGSNKVLDDIVQIAAGALHTCVLTTEGGVKCWGEGGRGELGAATSEDTNTPVVVMGADKQPLTGIVQLAAGFSFSCAVTISGGVKCWGAGGSGQLGNGSYGSKNMPVDVVDTDNKPLTAIVQITAIGSHACALTSSGTVKCWGRGWIGQLGNAKELDSAHAVDVVTAAGGARLADIVQVAVGAQNSYALTSAGNIKSWGAYHMLGNVDKFKNELEFKAQNVPVDVQSLNGIAYIASGVNHNCVINNRGYIQCWGAAMYGELGTGEAGTVVREVPSNVIIKHSSGDLLKIATQRAEQVCYDDGTCKIE